jgi:2-oxoisovalerate ferredoxin oxidoreductase beta subunit
MIVHEKPKAFYDTFERKGAGQQVTHYCPGCGHGTAHKLIAELLVDMDIQDRTIFLSPVGCSVFAYYYMDTGNIQCAHGRAPAVGTGIRRTHKDAILISYQGDGDLAAIGTAEIIHAANRGENMTVFFINNAIYGMTGGQMAPTTLEGQKTLTTPLGRSGGRDGHPIGMAEVMEALKTPVFIERVSLSTPGKVLKARKIFRKALQNQIDKKGFSFVEVLSPCPINWKMDPVQARKWMQDYLEPLYPVRNFRDDSDKPAPPDDSLPFLDSDKLIETLQQGGALPNVHQDSSLEEQRVKIAGFGGQGVLSAGILLANTAIAEGLNATWLPSYGPEMRGGKANASVIVSRKAIGSPVVDNPNVLIALNTPSLLSFEKDVLPGGLILINSSLVNHKVKREDVRTFYIPASDMAKESGILATANIVLLTIYLKIAGVADHEVLKQVLPSSVKRKDAVQLNLKMVEKALAYYEKEIRGNV